MSIQTISRAVAKSLSGEIEAALQELAAKHDIQINRGNCKFEANGTGMTLQVVVAVKGEDGAVVSKEASAFTEMAKFYGDGISGVYLEASDLGSEFSNRGKTFRITGLNTRSPKYPILALCAADGKTYKFQAEMIVKKLGKEKKVAA